jgi:hypothetical protein
VTVPCAAVGFDVLKSRFLVAGKKLLRLILGWVFHGRFGRITSCTHAILLKPGARYCQTVWAIIPRQSW